MRNDVNFADLTDNTSGSEQGLAWEGGDFALIYSGSFGEGSLTLEYSTRPADGFVPVVANPANEVVLTATGPGVVLGSLPKGYVRPQLSGATSPDIEVSMRPHVQQIEDINAR